MKITCSTPHNGVFFAGELFTCLITLTNGEKMIPLTNEEKRGFSKVQATAAPVPREITNLENSIKTQSLADTGSPSPSFFQGLLRGFLGNSSSVSVQSSPSKVQSSPSKNFHEYVEETQKKYRNEQNAENNSLSSEKPPLPLAPLNSQISFPNTQDTSTLYSTHEASSELIASPLAPLGESGGKINMAHPTLNDVAQINNQINISSLSRTFSNTPSTNTDFDLFSQAMSPDIHTPSLDQSLQINDDAISNGAKLKINQSNLVIQTKSNQSTDGSSEKIAMGFAQMTGQFTIDPHYIKKDSFSGLKDRVLYRIPGTDGSSKNSLVYGGGSLTTSISHHEKSIKPISDAFPLYNTPPTILFCDLTLGVGESKSFKYEILLPAVLPPSHSGKVIRCHYKLVIGIRSDIMNSATRVISVPFRFFNRTNVDGSRPVFELLNPVIHSKDQAMVVSVESRDASISPGPSTSFIKTPQLLEAEKKSKLTDSNQSLRASTTSQLETEFETLSADNVMNVLQLSGKVSYDICKNDEHISQLVLGRLGYRLGESVTAVLNFTKSTVPCYHVSVFLEMYESVEAQFAARSKDIIKQHTRICVGEFHQHIINSRRTAIVLNIPSKATPDFQSSAVSISWSLRFEFITGTGSRILSNMAELDGFEHQRSVSDVTVEPFDCTIPLKVYGALKTSKQHKKVLEFEL